MSCDNNCKPSGQNFRKSSLYRSVSAELTKNALLQTVFFFTILPSGYYRVLSGGHLYITNRIEKLMTVSDNRKLRSTSTSHIAIFYLILWMFLLFYN